MEHNVGANGKRVASGTYVLDALPGGGTRIEFEHAWRTAPRSERLLAPLARTLLHGGLRTAMQHLAAQLEQHDGARSAA